jgi:glutamate/tyrosine decarboxylase-like PLP-dependent enzyme
MLLDKDTRSKLWASLIESVESYLSNVSKLRVVETIHPSELCNLLASFTFQEPEDPLQLLQYTVEGLNKYQLHTSHPRYFGLYNPAPTIMGIVADTLVAAYNPQLASWNHSPFGVEIERHLVQAFGKRFGLNPDSIGGTFTSGGSEANHTALLNALVWKFPQIAQGQGLRELSSQPVIYIPADGHHSLLKAIRMSGLGQNSIRLIPCDEQYRMDSQLLFEQISYDRHDGLTPFMVVATAGTTSAGIIDPLLEVASIAKKESLWFHVDAAWGGAAVFCEELKKYLIGIEQADSITFDAHKWLCTPMGAGLYLTGHPELLLQTFKTDASYISTNDAAQTQNLYEHSMQWSRRFIGLKVFLSLAIAGWDGYAEVIRQQVALANDLRHLLEQSGWQLITKTPLPVVCFIPPEPLNLNKIATTINATGEAWISTTQIGLGHPQQKMQVLRVGIPNYRTTKEDVTALVQLLNRTRAELLNTP